MVKLKLNGKYELILPEHRADRLEWTTGWEVERLDSMHDNLGKGDVMYYIGAELGEMAALCQVWGADVVIFEPNHSAWPIIKAIWETNKLEMPIGIFPGFVSNIHQPVPTNPDLELHKNIFQGHGWQKGTDGWPLFSQGQIVKAHGFSELHQEADGLPQYRIDNLVEDGLLPPTAIAIDVEGSDFQVLLGAEKTIEKYHPKIWMSWHPEFMFGNWGTYLRNARDWLIGKGYTEKYLAYEHELHIVYLPK